MAMSFSTTLMPFLRGSFLCNLEKPFLGISQWKSNSDGGHHKLSSDKPEDPFKEVETYVFFCLLITLTNYQFLNFKHLL